MCLGAGLRRHRVQESSLVNWAAGAASVEPVPVVLSTATLLLLLRSSMVLPCSRVECPENITRCSHPYILCRQDQELSRFNCAIAKRPLWLTRLDAPGCAWFWCLYIRHESRFRDGLEAIESQTGVVLQPYRDCRIISALLLQRSAIIIWKIETYSSLEA